MSFLTEPTSLILSGKKRQIATITGYVVINESTTDTLTITKQPVQQGASITDHSYKEPTGFSTTVYFSKTFLDTLQFTNASLLELYQQLLDLQSSRLPFDITTPKRIYRNMLMSSLSQTTDKNTENILSISMAFQEVIIVSVTTTSVPREQLKNPGSNGPTQPAGVKQSIISKSADAGSGFVKAILRIP